MNTAAVALLPEFDVAERLSAKDARRIGVMYGRHGQAAAGTCRGCGHFRRPSLHGRGYSKCALSGDTRCAASDWNGRWPACGAWKEDA